MNTILKTVMALSLALALLNHAEADQKETDGSTANTEPGVVGKVERAVEHGAKAAATGVEHGLKAAGNGIERGAKAAGRGIDHGVKATKNAVHRVVNKTDNTDKAPASPPSK